MFPPPTKEHCFLLNRAPKTPSTISGSTPQYKRAVAQRGREKKEEKDKGKKGREGEGEGTGERRKGREREERKEKEKRKEEEREEGREKGWGKKKKEKEAFLFLEALSIYLRRGKGFVTFIKNVSIQCLLKKKKKSIWDFLLYFIKTSQKNGRQN